MKCVGCSYEAPISKFRYLYNVRIDDSLTLRQCPKCAESNPVNELKGEALQIVKPGDSPWGKSAGIEGVTTSIIDK
jgi:hypothetical protein